MTRNAACGLAGLALAGILAIASPGAAQTLTVGLASGATSADPHFHALTNNVQFRKHVHQGLVHMSATNRPEPELAVSWEKMSDTTWRFRLRPGVVFHNGSPFTARDVIYSYCRVPNVPNSPGLFRPYTAAIRAMRAPDPLTLEIDTAGPAPFLADDLANVGIVSAEAAGAPAEFTFDGRTCGITAWPATADFNANGPVAVGTGPFRLESFQPNTAATLVRFDGYWGRKPDHARLVMQVIANHGARAAALLSGAVDVIDRPPAEALDRLRAAPGAAIFQAPPANIIYMSFDQVQEPSPAITGTDGRNPFKDVRVRTAVSRAINRDAIVARILSGTGSPAHQMAAPTMLGHDPALPPEPHDPEGARALLAEAGYPRGFGLTLHTTSGRYQSDVEVAQAIAQMLARIGIRTEVEAVPPAVYFTNATNQKYSFFLAGVGGNFGEGLMVLRALGHTRTGEFGSLNRGRYSNPALDALIVEGLRTMDDARRAQVTREAVGLFTRDRGVLPVFHEAMMWASRGGLVVEGRADHLLLAYAIRKAQ
jgi:peptide/nickel transport system substrate-binding protein